MTSDKNNQLPSEPAGTGGSRGNGSRGNGSKSNGDNGVYGLLGHPLGHSYSKEIHEALGKYSYELFSLDYENMEAMVRSREFDGLNVTIPYKQEVIRMCDEISPLAASIGAVNTLYHEKDSGRLIGHNTDYEGFLYAADRAGIDFSGKSVLVLGSGGTSRTVRKALRDRDAGEIYIASRKIQSPAENKIQSPAGNKDKAPIHITYDELAGKSDTIDIIINTTPVGTFPGNLKRVISLSDFKNCSGVIDVIYNPFKTALLLEAEKAGIAFSNGLPMLVAQATAAAGRFLGMPGAFQSENERIITKMTKETMNIILVGMPGAGKTTIGRIISKITGKTFVDMDAEIERETGMTIPQIFFHKGEPAFRDMEASMAAQLGKKHSLVIATGGGTILRNENIDALRQNGTVIHITRPSENLSTEGRPLSKSREALIQMRNERMPLYKAASDAEFNNVYDIETTSKNIASLLEKL